MPGVSEAKPKRKLTPKQERFVREYLVDLNATDAARRAGYSERNAGKIGPELLGKTSVREAIAEAQQQRQGRLEITGDRVVEQMARVAFFDPLDLLDDDGTPLPLRRLPARARAAISSMSISYSEEPDSDGVFRRMKHVDYRFRDMLKALEQLGRHLGLFQDTTNVNVLVKVTRQVESMSDAELRALLDRARGAAALPPPGGGRAEEAGDQRP